jgi:hypothetical protein
MQDAHFGGYQRPDIGTEPAVIALPVEDDLVSDPVFEVAWIELHVSRETDDRGFHLEHGILLARRADRRHARNRCTRRVSRNSPDRQLTSGADSMT